MAAPVSFGTISFFDPSTPSMIKLDDREDGGKKKNVIIFIVDTNAIAIQLP